MNRKLVIGTTASFTLAAVIGGTIVYKSNRPVEQIGPFNHEKMAFIRSEDGNISIQKLWIENGMLVAAVGTKEKNYGRIRKIKDTGFAVGGKEKGNLECLTYNAKEAVCGAVRYQKSLGKFQFDRKIPFTMNEMIMGTFLGRGGGSATTNGTVMFKSDDSSLWIKSENVGTFKFLTPTTFKIEWKTPLIYLGGARTGHVLDKPRITRRATCVINKEIQQSIICNGTTASNTGQAYSAIWKYVDSDDANNSIGANKPQKNLMDRHD